MKATDFALIRKLELTTRKQISGPLLGGAQSNLKGSGFEFHQLRDYEQGDDIRFIDWKSSARSNKMLVRQYLEDRNRMVYVAVDVSGSTEYGIGTVLKSDLMKQLAAIFAFVSLHRNDSVGLILFSEEVEKIIPPRSSRAHVFSLVETLYSYTPKQHTTRLDAPLEYLARLRGQKALVCLISDFMNPFDGALLSLIGRHHDVMAMRCLDEREIHFPSVGTLVMEDRETLQKRETHGHGGRIQQALTLWHRAQKEKLAQSKVDSLDLVAGKPFSGELVRFLRTRVYG